MIISNHWLSDYVSHDLSVDDLAELLTMCGLEVEGIVQIGSSLDGVVIGHVLTCEPHPNADRLRLCSVKIGEAEPITIVCGAPNVEAGQKIAVATIGSVLHMPSREDPNEKIAVTVRKSKIRGEVSFGMICSEVELGVGDDQDGILVLDHEAPVGEAFSDWISEEGVPLVDHAIDIAITPNRPDAVCHVGVARDVAALTGKQLKMPEIDIPDHGKAATDEFSVTIEATDVCQEYVGILVRDIRVDESPRWLKQRLLAVGLRPRNNIVDITNYVMYELGQPLHGFDFDTLADSKIIVRKTSGETEFVTLDGNKRTLPAGTMMIADGERDIAIAGIMGGENSEVTRETTSVLIESAYFDPVQIRRTARKLQIQTDASYRFERGVDPCAQARAAARAAELMVRLAGGTLVPGMVSARSVTVKPTRVTLRRARANALIGVDLPAAKMVSLLEAIGFEIQISDDEESFDCTIPTFRPDIEREVDIIEEVARLYGFDKIPEPVRSSVPDHAVEIPARRLLREDIRDRLAAIGFRELYTNSMLRLETAEAFQVDILPGGRLGGNIVKTLNPISQEMAALRPSLLPGTLAIAGYNANHGRKSLRYFEIGNVQIRAHSNESIIDGYTEKELLLLVVSGDDAASGLHQDVRKMDYFDLKGVAETLLRAVHLAEVRFESGTSQFPVASSYSIITSVGEYVGVLGELSASIRKQYDIPAPLFFLELDWSTISRLAEPFLRKRYEAFSRFPVVERDLAVTVGANTPVGKLLQQIRESGKPLLSGVSVFDLYEGDQIDSTMKSVAFSLKFSADRTLVDKEVDLCFDGIVKVLKSESGAELRR